MARTTQTSQTSRAPEIASTSPYIPAAIWMTIPTAELQPYRQPWDFLTEVGRWRGASDV